MITVLVEPHRSRYAINPLIYGAAYASEKAIHDLQFPVLRLGGNNLTRYNWRANADNRGSDWFFETIPDPSPVPSERADTFEAQARHGGAVPMLTVPMIGYEGQPGANRAKRWSFGVHKYGAQSKIDPYLTDAGSGVRTDGKPVTGNDPHDANVAVTAEYHAAWIRHLRTRFGAASAAHPRYYLLDNEPGLWHVTHRDVHPQGRNDGRGAR